MQWALVFHLVVTVFVAVHSKPEICVFQERGAFCGKYHIPNTLDLIPAIAQNITSIHFEAQPLKQLAYNAFGNVSSQSGVSKIWLERCQISHVDAGALLNLHNLSFVYLSRNEITHIDGKLFTDTKRIQIIFLDRNKIEVLPSGLFQNLTLLEEVHLEHNRIRQVEWYSFRNTPALRIIDLSMNDIESINVAFKDTFENLKYLLLQYNPWKCDCELGPFYKLVMKNYRSTHYWLECQKPPTLAGRKWSDVSRSKFVCPSADGTSALVSSTEPGATTAEDKIIPAAVYSGRTVRGIVKRKS